VILLDVRTKEEYDSDHIDGALLHDIIDMMQGVFPKFNKNEEIALYCESGNRSMMAKSIMEKVGFSRVTDLGSIDNLRQGNNT